MDANIFPLLALLVTMIGWIATYVQQKKLLEKQITAEEEREFRTELQDKVIEVQNHIALYAKLNGLYRLKSGFSSLLVRDENGNIVSEGGERYKVEEKYFQSDPTIEEAFIQKEGISIENLANQIKATILLNSGNIIDILSEIDPSKNSVERLRELYLLTIHSYDFLFRNPQYWDKTITPAKVFELINQSDASRRELREQLEIAVKKKKAKGFSLGTSSRGKNGSKTRLSE